MKQLFLILFMMLQLHKNGHAITNCGQSVTPSSISSGGQVKITITGCGFSKNQFNFGEGNEQNGNRVLLYTDSGMSSECDVLKYDSHGTQITCMTRRLAEKNKYKIKIFVDGKELATSLSIQTNAPSPYIDSIVPSSGVPNTILKISGWTYTDLYSSTDQKGSFDKTEKVLRVYSSSQICDLLKPNSDNLYGISTKSNGKGYMICKIDGNFIGYQNVSFILSGKYGSSITSTNILKVNLNHDIYMFQSYAVINSIVQPTIGSQGGAHVTINGQYFYKSRPEVFLDEIRCEAQLPFKTNEISCILDRKEMKEKPYYPGNRGVTIEYWETNEDIATFHFSRYTSNYKVSYSDDFSWSLGKSVRYIVSASAFFIVSRSGEHEFVSKYPCQKIVGNITVKDSNLKLNLVEGQKILLKILCDQSTNELSVIMFNTSYSNEQLAMVTNEYQEIIIAGDTDQEIQEIQFNDFTNSDKIKSASEIQSVDVLGPSGEYALCAFSTCTDWILKTDNFKTISNKIQRLFSLTNETKVTGNENHYEIHFQRSLGNIYPLTYKIKDHSLLTVDIKTVKDGITGTDKFYLTLNKVTSQNTVDTTNLNGTLPEALESLLVTYCPIEIGKSSLNQYFYDFEDDINDYPVFCGRRSSFKKEVPFNLIIDFSPYLCFGYKNLNSIIIRISWMGGSNNVTMYFTFYEEWNYKCVNILDEVKKNFDHKFKTMSSIYFNGYADNVNVGTRPLVDTAFDVLIQRRLPAYTIKSFKVAFTSNFSARIEIFPDECAHSLDLISVSSAQRLLSGNSSIVFWKNNNATMTAIRVKRASIPPSGTYSLKYGRYIMEDIPWNTSLTLNSLKTFPSLGKMSISTKRNCRYVSHGISFLFGGMKTMLEISASNVSGDIRDFNVYRTKQHSIKMSPIPGDMLQTCEYSPQITVKYFGILSKCIGTCSISINSNMSSSLTNVNSMNNSSYNTQLRISVHEINLVNISSNYVILISKDGKLNYSCDVTVIETPSTLKCNIIYLPLGIYDVLYSNKEFGYARNILTFFQQPNTELMVLPTKGPSSGGILITIFGDGFENVDLSVNIGGKICKITHAYRRNITCILPFKDSDESNVADVKVSQWGITITKSKAFLYEDIEGATIRNVYPNNSLHSSGNETIIIIGSKFGDVLNNVVVKIGDTVVDLVYVSDDRIQIRSPSMNHGIYPLTIYINGIGQAKPRNITVEYVFQITSINPNMGSFAGGTVLSINGMGFNQTNLSVSVGSNLCIITSLTDTEITCETTSIFKKHVLSLKENYAGPQWTKESLAIDQGDSVEWTWDTICSVQISEVFSLDNLTILIDKPRVSMKTQRGSFIRYFSNIGIHAFKTTVGERNIVVGVTVHKRDIQVANINVEISNKSASQNNTGQYFNVSSIRKPCLSALQPNNVLNPFKYIYHPCLTYVVSDISPLMLESDQRLNIQFHEDVQCTPYVTLTFQGTSILCALVNLSGPTLSFIPNVASFSQLPPLVPVFVSVKCKESGNVLYKTNTYGSSPFIYPSPTISDIFPTYGSIYGGTIITIRGHNLPNNELQKILIGNYPCVVMNSTRQYISCKTSPANKEFYADIKVYITNQTKFISCSNNCSFSFTLKDELKVTSCTPSSVNDSFSLTIFGSNFGVQKDAVRVLVGEYHCPNDQINDQEIKTTCPSLPLGRNEITIFHEKKGLYVTTCSISSEKTIKSIHPLRGSVQGGTYINIVGNGFKLLTTSVLIGSTPCTIINIKTSLIDCVTLSKSAGSHPLVVKVDGEEYESVMFEYDDSLTPQVTSITSNHISFGDNVTLIGTGWTTNMSDISLKISGTSITILAVTNNSITFYTPDLDPGVYRLFLTVYNKGLAQFLCNDTVRVKLEISNITFNEGNILGGQKIIILGSGFKEHSTSVWICNESCTDLIVMSRLKMSCYTPRTFADYHNNVTCNVKVKCLTESSELKGAFIFYDKYSTIIYKVSPLSGERSGGTDITITGSGFASSGNTARIDGSACLVKRESNKEIVCETSSHRQSGSYSVEVYHDNSGLAKGKFFFTYIDRWSSTRTWNGSKLPQEGDFIVISQDQHVLLDTDTPVLKMLLLNGGKLIFDRTRHNLTLQSEYILINNGGSLEIGSETEPYENVARIVLHGNLRGKELPIYGVKMIAVRNGTLSVHGHNIDVPWTRLSRTSEAGSSEIELLHAVDWKVGDSIVIATTGDRYSQKETEEHIIKEIKIGNKILTLSEKLKYRKLGGIFPDVGPTLLKNTMIGAEVGLLSRNIRIEGSQDVKWTENITACPGGFDTGESATQTCFRGRFGEENGSDEFGGHILAHPPVFDSQVAVVRMSGVELYYMGQAFRMGRYPIHFHLGGDMSRSYVKRVSIHRTFNRAVVIHGSHNVLVEYGVFYDIKGGALFLEDGIEHGNIFQYNLVVKTLQSTSLQNDDITPSSFWATNPNNTFVHNAVAGGSHFGIWYRMHQHPDAASYSPDICPKKDPFGQFKNNSAHSFGWFGLWIFPDMFPTFNGECASTTWTRASFEDFISWNNEKGVECVNCGSIQFSGFLMLNNEKAGIEGKLLKNTYSFSKVNGPVYMNSLIVGNAPELSSIGETCTKEGLVLPWSNGLVVSNVMFRNFDRDTCTPISATTIVGHCLIGCGGWNVHFEGTSFENTLSKIKFRWHSDFIITDLDGTISARLGETKIVPWFNVYPKSECIEDKSASFSHGVSGAFCSPSIKFVRFSAHSTQISIETRNIRIYAQSNGIEYNDTINYYDKRLTTRKGWMASLPSNRTYRLEWIALEYLQNISYIATLHQANPGDWIIFRHKVSTPPDKMAYGFKLNTTLNPHTDNHLSYYFDKNENTVELLVKNMNQMVVDLEYRVQFYECFWPNCIAPPTINNRTDEINYIDMLWNGSSPPTGCEINSTTYVRANFSYSGICDVLIIRGILEFIVPNSPNKTTILIARIILIIGGKLLAGNSSNPYTGMLKIMLRGHINDKEYVSMDSPPIGNKVIAVFGELQLFGIDNGISWTNLKKTARVGETVIYINDSVQWTPGSQIVLTTTHYSHLKNDVVYIISVDNEKGVIEIDRKLRYNHHAGKIIYADGQWIASEVGLLTKNILISSDNNSTATFESFGGRIFASKLLEKQTSYSGSIQLFGVELRNMGQFGFIERHDARFALSFISLGDVSSKRISFVQQSSFNNIFSPAIGAFDTSGIRLESNVIYRTQGEGIILSGSNHIIKKNLIVEVNWDGGHYRPMQGSSAISNRPIWTAGIDVSAMSMSSGLIAGNIVAGSERSGLRLNDVDCTKSYIKIHGNVIHSTMIGIYLEDKRHHSGCNKIEGVFIYRAYDFGIFYERTESLSIINVLLADNGIGLNAFVFSPSSKSHVVDNKYVNISNSTIIGSSGILECDDVVDSNVLLSSTNGRSFRSDSGGSYGILISNFVSGHNEAPEKAFNNLRSYNSIGGKTEITGVSFINFNTQCGSRKDVAIATNKANDDGIHPCYIKDLKFVNTPTAQRFFIHRPNLEKINPSDCVDMDCDGLKKVLLVDLDGSIKGNKSSIFSQSEWEWNGDSRRGLGDYRLPKNMLLTPTNVKLEPEVVYPNKGIFRNQDCIYEREWQAYYCPNSAYEMMIIESMDYDTETRRLSPVAIATDWPKGNFVDLINGPQDHGWCSGYTCQTRISTFMSIVPRLHNFVLYFTSGAPQHLRLRFLNTDEKSSSIRLGIFYAIGSRFDVFADSKYVIPLNGYYKNEQLLLKEPSFKFMPNSTNGQPGDNYYSSNNNIQYVILQGSSVVDIKTSPLIHVGFNLPTVSITEFYGEKIVEYLANYLNIPKNKIRVINIVTENTPLIRTKRSLSIVSRVELEIGYNSNVNDSALTMNDTLQKSNLNYLLDKLIIGFQTGDLSRAMNSSVSGLTVMRPLPDASTKEWTALSNDTIKSSNVINIQIPVSYKAKAIGSLEEGQNLEIHVESFDEEGRHVTVLSTETIKYKAVLTFESVEGFTSTILFNTNDNGWAFFKNVDLEHRELKYVATITIFTVSGNDVVKRSELQLTLQILQRFFSLKIVNFPSSILQARKEVAFYVQVIDKKTMENAGNMNWNDHQWQVHANVCVQSPLSNSSLSVKVVQKIVAGNNYVILPVVSFLNEGAYRICLRLELYNKPLRKTYYQVDVISPQLTVREPDYATPKKLFSTSSLLIFGKSQFSLIQSQTEMFETTLFNTLHFQLLSSYRSVLTANYTFSKGSINCYFETFSSNQNHLYSFTSEIEKLVGEGSVKFILHENEFQATSIIVHGNNMQKSNEKGGVISAIISAIFCGLVLIAVIIGIVRMQKCNSRKRDGRDIGVRMREIGFTYTPMKES